MTTKSSISSPLASSIDAEERRSMKLGIALGYSGATLSLPVETVLRAEALGYDSVWTSEVYGSDAITPLAYLAAVTRRIRLGTSIMQLAGRAPTMCAMQVATLDALAGGNRVIAGLGLSGPQVVEGWYGQPWGRPYYRLRDYVTVMKKVFARQEPVTHDGKEFQLPYHGAGATGLGKPIKSILHMNPAIPVMLGSGTEGNVRLAGEICDGLLPLGFCPEAAPTYRSWIEEGFRRAGKTDGWRTFELQGVCPVIVTNDLDAAFRSMKPHIALYAGGMGHGTKNFHNDMMVRRGYGDAARRIQDLYVAGRKDEAAQAVPDEYCDASALIGSPDRIRERYRAWADSGITGLTITGSDEAMELMAKVADLQPAAE
jgi:F420-dependent oxidoreductase-like protein